MHGLAGYSGSGHHGGRRRRNNQVLNGDRWDVRWLIAAIVLAAVAEGLDVYGCGIGRYLLLSMRRQDERRRAGEFGRYSYLGLCRPRFDDTHRPTTDCARPGQGGRREHGSGFTDRMQTCSDLRRRYSPADFGTYAEPQDQRARHSTGG